MGLNLFMLSFRKKILLSDLILFLVFIALLFPFIERTVNYIVRTSLTRRTNEEIAKLETLSMPEELIDALAGDRVFMFFRVTLFDAEGRPIYDSHVITRHAEEDPEVEQAFAKGRSFLLRYSDYLGQSMAYVAVAFEAGGHKYVLRMGLPFTEIHALMQEFELSFILLGVSVLLLYGIMTWAVIYRLSLPIQQIIDAIRPYQEGKDEFIPRIEFKKEIQEKDEFGQLAKTLNSMNLRIQKQIDTLKQQRDETEAILESLGEGVIAIHPDERILFANRVACQILRIEQQKIEHQKLNALQGGRTELLKRCLALVRSALDQSQIVVENFLLEDPQKLYLNLIAAPLAHHRGIVLVLQDKSSDLKILEMGKDFVANASHELRTPLTILRGFAETLQDLPDLSQEILKEIAEKILKTTFRLETLVKSLLTLADLEGLSESQLHSMDLLLLAESCMQNLRAIHPQVQISLRRKIPQALVRGDVALLEMAIMNLLENAVRYSPAPAHISLTIDRIPEWVRLTIADRGIGIPEADLPHIFDRFYTIDKARSRKFGGTGLGLSIVKAIFQKHHGEITVTSQLGQGTTFILCLRPIERETLPPLDNRGASD
jgi:two-component system, OmpR family, phosphate regulon sensor histidine kinase PhoR